MPYGTPNIYLATIAEVKKSSVKVRYNNTISDFVPYTQTHNAFKTAYSPPTIGEIVLYFKLGQFGVVLGTSILSADQESKQDEKTQRTEYADGTIITYSDGTLKVESLKEITLECENALFKIAKDATIECQNATIKTDKAIINSTDITLGGENAPATAGVVTGECTCAFTGGPHPVFSSKVKALK
ncbi:phage baseplate assembly protein V [Helicobacter cynogastricus]|uniref:phage baseplate assembly protein V n=1 Tax=Helicobacter cynogastricus TaxID=329937 RepID=UPI000CF1511B|nr:phage baseplate assembly protein V [Helicobacter cynogastricus]